MNTNRFTSVASATITAYFAGCMAFTVKDPVVMAFALCALAVAVYALAQLFRIDAEELDEQDLQFVVVTDHAAGPDLTSEARRAYPLSLRKDYESEAVK